MKRKIKHMVIPVLLVLATLLIVGCNTENEGIFMRISESVEKVDVGAVTLIGSNGSGLMYAHTTKKGIQSYDSITDSWTRIINSDGAGTPPGFSDSNPVSRDRVSYNSTVDELYFATKSSEGSNNNFYVYDTASPTSSLSANSSMIIKRMHPNFNLMIIDVSGTLHVIRPSEVGGVGLDLTLSGIYVEQIVLAQSENIFIVSGYDYDKSTSTTTYYHEFYNAGALTTIDPDVDSVIVAFFHDGTNLVLITNDGGIWTGTDPETMTLATTKLSLPSTNMSFRNLPLMTDGTSYYIQGDNRTIYKINANGTFTDATDDFDTILRNTDIYSFLKRTSDNKYFVGTKDNGIVEVVFP